MFQAICKCGFRSDEVADMKRAECLAEIHERTRNAPHKHDAVVARVSR